MRQVVCSVALCGALGLLQPAMAASVRGSAGAGLGDVTGNSQFPGNSFSTSVPGPHSIDAFFQQVFVNPANEPVLGVLSTATITAEIGRLAGYASAEATGSFVAGVLARPSAKAEGTAFDRITVESATLAPGTPVELTFDLVVSGNGRFFADFRVTQLGTPGGQVPKRLTLDMSGSFNGIGGQRTGTIQALVGERYNLEYGLSVTALVSTVGLVDATRFSVSDYSQTAHYFALPSSSAVVLRAESGFDYSPPATVPLPAAAMLLVSALPVAWRFGLRARRAA